MRTDPIKLEIYKHLFAAIAEEMGVVLRKASFSPNIKERRDFSCAVFDTQGKMIAQAAHIPVHLGSMPLSVEYAIKKFTVREQDSGDGITNLDRMEAGDVIVVNDPYQGGTHLPDITLVSPVFTTSDLVNQVENPPTELVGFVASRAHHADVGGMTPGSMPIAREIYQEGLIIPPIKLFDRGRLNQSVWDLIMANVRTSDERAGDLWAQIAANHRGSIRFQEIVTRYGRDEAAFYMGELLAYTERMTRKLLLEIPDGTYSYLDYLDDDGIGEDLVPISVTLTVSGDQALVDFSESAPQQSGSVNAVYAITLSAVYYVFRCLLNLDVPNNSGCLVPIEVIAPPGTVVNAQKPAPVAGGNVETSQRIVDVLLGAFAKAYPGKIPAASQGTMNNLTIGGWDREKNKAFTYYETIGGGMGALPDADGPSALHSHMTNTLNTPIEALEYAYPMRVVRYEIRRESGGIGKFKGGEGILREIETLVEAQVTLLTERRRLPPYGLSGGNPGLQGENIRISDGERIRLPGKGNIHLNAGDRLLIKTPGGGGFGNEE